MGLMDIELDAGKVRLTKLSPTDSPMARLDFLFIVLMTWCLGIVGALSFSLLAP